MILAVIGGMLPLAQCANVPQKALGLGMPIQMCFVNDVHDHDDKLMSVLEVAWALDMGA